ncbi:MAG: FmdE family protein [Candidatus Thorarchaeota archaeon]
MEKFNTDIPDFNDLVNVGFILHNHICPAMPLGLRAGLLALKKLNMSRSQNKELKVLIENGPDHAALCFSEGVQVATSCTFGKGNISRTNEGKNAFTLIDLGKNQAIRISIKFPFFQNMLNSEFVQKRKSGIEPYQIDKSVALTAIGKMLQVTDENIFSFTNIFDYKSERKSGTFDYLQCEQCKEPVFESGIRKKGNNLLCQKCSGY